ncbi:hypothetical protein ACTFIU_004294 [Dictyostelium citrinum]
MSVPGGLVAMLQFAQCNIRTSSNYNGDHSQNNAILNYKTSVGSESWCAASNNTNQFIIAGCEVPRTFTHIAIQGRGNADQWVTSYKIRYCLLGGAWIDYKGGQAIQGNTDRNTVVVHQFETPIRARAIAIHPLTWNGHISLRFEVYSQPAYDFSYQNGIVDTRGNDALSNHDGNGSTYREVVSPLVFANEFITKPTVTVSLNCSGNTSFPINVGVEQRNVTTKGFDCVFKIWGGSKMNSLVAEYVAIGQE